MKLIQTHNHCFIQFCWANDPIKVVEWNKAFMIVGHELSEMLLSYLN